MLIYFLTLGVLLLPTLANDSHPSEARRGVPHAEGPHVTHKTVSLPLVSESFDGQVRIQLEFFDGSPGSGSKRAPSGISAGESTGSEREAPPNLKEKNSCSCSPRISLLTKEGRTLKSFSACGDSSPFLSSPSASASSAVSVHTVLSLTEPSLPRKGKNQATSTVSLSNSSSPSLRAFVSYFCSLYTRTLSDFCEEKVSEVVVPAWVEGEQYCRAGSAEGSPSHSPTPCRPQSHSWSSLEVCLPPRTPSHPPPSLSSPSSLSIDCCSSGQPFSTRKAEEQGPFPRVFAFAIDVQWSFGVLLTLTTEEGALRYIPVTTENKDLQGFCHHYQVTEQHCRKLKKAISSRREILQMVNDLLSTPLSPTRVSLPLSPEAPEESESQSAKHQARKRLSAFAEQWPAEDEQASGGGLAKNEQISRKRVIEESLFEGCWRHEGLATVHWCRYRSVCVEERTGLVIFAVNSSTARKIGRRHLLSHLGDETTDRLAMDTFLGSLSSWSNLGREQMVLPLKRKAEKSSEVREVDEGEHLHPLRDSFLLPPRSFLIGRFHSISSLASRKISRWVSGKTFLATPLTDKSNIYHWAEKFMVAYTIRQAEENEETPAPENMDTQNNGRERQAPTPRDAEAGDSSEDCGLNVTSLANADTDNSRRCYRSARLMRDQRGKRTNKLTGELADVGLVNYGRKRFDQLTIVEHKDFDQVAWQEKLIELLFGKEVTRSASFLRIETSEEEDEQERSPAPLICYDDVTIPGASPFFVPSRQAAEQFFREVSAKRRNTSSFALPLGSSSLLDSNAEYIVLISRAAARTRKIINEAELIEPLRKLWDEEMDRRVREGGLEKLRERPRKVVLAHLQGLSFEEQIFLFSRCVMLVALHGAGLANILFLPPGAVVVEISEPLFPKKLYQTLAMATGHPYFIHLARDNRDRQGQKFSEEEERVYYEDPHFVERYGEEGIRQCFYSRKCFHTSNAYALHLSPSYFKETVRTAIRYLPDLGEE